MKKTLFATFALCAAMCSCGSKNDSTTLAPSDIPGKWIITQAGELSTEQAEQQPYINFTDSGTINGSAAVNTFFGNYTTDGDTIAFTQLGITSMMGDDGNMDIEAAVVQALNNGKSLEMQDNTLIIKDAQGISLMMLTR